MPELRISVRELAEFCHRRGDIDYRFSPSPSAEQGIAGHQLLQRRRGEHYQAEYALELIEQGDQYQLRLAGRADGYDPSAPLLEEIKTCRVERSNIPVAIEDLHWAQVMLYGGMLCRNQPELDNLELQLTYYNIDSGEEWSRREIVRRCDLLDFLADSLMRIGDWLSVQQAWRETRDTSIASLAFPWPEFRRGQRDMAETVYKCITRSGRALLQAPTGTGKTAAVLFPAIKALAADKHERVCYITARTVGRRAAEDTLRMFSSKGLKLRWLSVTAKDAICFSPGKSCHGDDCPFARGYYDRLPAALNEAMRVTDLDRPGVEALARQHEVCPYQLSLDLLPWVDLCIGDSHYTYSLNPSISSVYSDRGLRWTLLLDEAHNLPARARDMYSASLSKAALMQARRESSGSIKRALDGFNRLLLALNREDWQMEDFDSREAAPDSLAKALQAFVAAVNERQAADPLVLQQRPALLEWYFDTLHFQRVLELFDSDFRFEMSRMAENRPSKSQSLVLRLRCLDASRLLAERQQRPLAVVAFSATVSPPRWMLDELGFNEGAVFNELPSPFSAQQYEILLNTRLDIRFRARAATLPLLAAEIAEWLKTRPGNCIVYFSAYQYMEDAVALLKDAGLDRHICVQQRRWTEEQRNGLLDTLAQRRDVAAFCILGGVFGEGIDLPGEYLSSVIVVGVGLPQFSREREVLRRYYQIKTGKGFHYAYLYPGMQRVCQALGRVIRRDSDTGSALLIDQRFANPEYRALLPAWWDYRM